MLRITQNSNAAGAKSYYSTSDYYSEGQDLIGVWRGKAAERLGLAGEVQHEQWDALCDNRDPATGRTLTARQKRERRIGYDFNFHVPKSVSLAYAMTGDERILVAFRDSVRETMTAIEAEAKTRVRAGGRNEDRVTGNLAWGEFIHLTARPVDGVPDPHLHAHCFVFNTTWDADENRWKAGQFADLKRDAPFLEAVFHAKLAGRLADMGLVIERTRKGWELADVPASALQRFSRRTALIEAAARAKGITDPDAKGELGAKTRERKQTELPMGALRDAWRARLTPEEREAIAGMQLTESVDRHCDAECAAHAAVEHALQYCFERSAVVPERMAQAQAMKHAYGRASIEQVLNAWHSRPLLKAERDSRTFVTTPEVLDEERRMLDFARSGRGTRQPLGDPDHAFQREWLNDGQRNAVRHVLGSPDRVMLIRGAAGTGKTSMMREAVEAIEANGHRVFTFAPSADASRGVLRSEGFANADTLARLLLDEQMQAQTLGQVIWIDEAGLVGSRTMARLFDLADRLGARVILSGDTRQHGSVERGAALRLLETEAGIKPAEIREIQRQKERYKHAVAALSDGRVTDGFRELAELGWVREVPAAERYKTLATDYVDTVAAGKSALVVSPTHLEGEWITEEIRNRLHASGILAGQGRSFTVLEPAHLTEAERTDPASYLPGDVLVYHQNAKGIRRGARLTVGVDPVRLSDAPRFQVFHRRAMDIRPGEVIRITRNGTTADGNHKLNNGGLFTVKGFTKSGDIELGASVSAGGKRRPLRGWTIARDYGHIDYGYVVTSHASQGRTVDRVFIGQSAASRPAASREQFYVSVSRGREQAIIYTDDRDALLEAVSRADERPSAIEYIAQRDRHMRAAVLEPATSTSRKSPSGMITPDLSRQSPSTTITPDFPREHREPEYER